MSNMEQEFFSLNVFDECLLKLYAEQFNFSSFKSLLNERFKESNNIISSLVNDINENDDTNFVVNMSDDLKDKYKNGLICFDKDKEGNMYAQLRDENGRYGKKLNIKEETHQTDLVFAAQLSSIKDVLVEIVNVLENVDEKISCILEGLHNDRVGLYYSGLTLYLEALQVTDNLLKSQLISQSIKSLNDAQAQLIQELKTDIKYLKSSEFKKVKKKKHDILVDKMQSIHECYQTINRIVAIKAMIYFDNRQLSSIMMVCTEYQRFIDAMVKPNEAFLIECDPRTDSLINNIWNKRAKTVLNCIEFQKQLMNTNHLVIGLEDK